MEVKFEVYPLDNPLLMGDPVTRFMRISYATKPVLTIPLLSAIYFKNKQLT